MNGSLGVLALTLLLSALSPTFALAQIGQAELRGAIVDESGLAVPGVTITATHVATGTSRSIQTSETGTYVMPALPIGVYNVKADLVGFASVQKEGITLNVGTAAIVNFSLQLATVQETITVVNEAPLGRYQAVGACRERVAEAGRSLPLNGRNWLDLVALVPGARGNPGAIQAGASGSDMAKYQVDGVDITNQCCGGSNTAYSQENIAEFQVLTNRFDAEHGRVNGAVINAVTKSGTNSFAAPASGTSATTTFGDAENFFTRQVSPFEQTQTGLNSGGPILRNKAFYFASFEYQNLSATARPNTGIPQFDGRCRPIRHGITRRRARTCRSTAHIGCSTRFSVYNWEQLNTGVDGTHHRAGGNSRPSKNNDLSLGHTWVIGSRLVNEVRAGFSAIDNRLQPNSPTVRWTFRQPLLGSPTNSPQWWEEMNIQVNELAVLHRARLARRAQHEEWASSSSGRISGARSPTRRTASSRSPRIRPISTIRRPIRAHTLRNPARRHVVQHHEPDLWAVLSGQLGVESAIHVEPRPSLRPRDRHDEHGSAEPDPTGRASAWTPTTSRRASVLPTTFAATAEPWSAPGWAATTTR